MSARNEIISEFKIENFPSNALETAEFWCIVSLAVILRLLLHFSLICTFYFYLVK